MDAFPDALVRGELLALVHADAWPLVRELCTRVKFFTRREESQRRWWPERDETLRWLDWADGLASRYLPGGPGSTSTPLAVSWRHPLIEQLGKEGFNILAEGKKGSVQVNTEMIAATGNGGRGSYDKLIGRNKFQGNQTVIIESILTDGTKLRSAPAKF